MNLELGCDLQKVQKEVGFSLEVVVGFFDRERISGGGRRRWRVRMGWQRCVIMRL